ncbi:MAG: triose-phosphate isomerase [Candidatus Sumerlaeia bacterium]|nr:triose-phosphate isomerase [Candidatus Sumerlaeia bacterium]
MARLPVIVGNWKMNLTRSAAADLVQQLRTELDAVRDVEVGVCPVFTVIPLVAPLLAGSAIRFGAQNVAWADSGAFTGEVSGEMLRELGCSYAIVGHSERRQHFGETDERVNARAKAALRWDLTPIVCVGETLKQREADETMTVVTAQVQGCFAGWTAAEARRAIIAYEPVWAIGTGKVATPAQAQEVHAVIRALLTRLFDAGTAQSIRIQYGGSVKPDNVEELMAQPDIDGALVGGASLKAKDFVPLVKFK